MDKTFTPKTALTHNDFLNIGRGYFYGFSEPQDSKFSAIFIAEKIEEKDIWGKWKEARLQSTTSLCKIKFKGLYTAEQKLAFIDQYIIACLLHYGKKSNYIRNENDLLKYRSWIVNKTLRQMNSSRKSKYSIPNGIKELINDICLFHKSNNRTRSNSNSIVTKFKSADIQSLQTMDHFYTYMERLKDKINKRKKHSSIAFAKRTPATTPKRVFPQFHR